MRTNGATWKAYLASWPDGQWYDDSDERIDGKEHFEDEPSDTSVVEFTYGTVYATRNDFEGVSLVSHFRKWLKAQMHTTVVCSVPTAELEDFKRMLKNIKGTLVT